MNIFKEPSIRQITVSVSIILMFSVISIQSQAQQNPYPFTVDLNFGGGLIGDSNANTAFQPEFGFSYMPGKFGIGLNAGLLSYDPSFDAQQYSSGFEDYTSVSGSDKKWSSFFFGIGPRFEFGSRLPVTFSSSLDLSLSYNSPPSVFVDFNDPDNATAGSDLQLAGYQVGEDYSKWSAALRPEFQMQFSPGGSDRFAIQITTGIQHRLSKNGFTYTQKDLSEVRLVPNSEEMFAQFDGAPTVQQSSHPPQTNFFTSVGFKIKFGRSRTSAAPGQDYNAARSNKPTSRAEDVGDGDLDSDGDGIGDAIETAQDYNSSRSNKPRTEDSRGGNDKIVREANRMARLIHPPNAIISAGSALMGINPLYEGSTSEGENPLYEGQYNDGDTDHDDNNDSQDPSPVQQYELQPSSFCMELSTMKVSTNSQKGMRAGDSGSGSTRIASATDYNSSRSNTTSSVDLGGDGNGDPGSDSTRIAAATDYNSSRSNTTSSVDLGGDGNGDQGSDSTRIAAATDYNSSRSNTTSSVDTGGDGNGGQGSDSTRIAAATDYNSSRSNTTSSVDLGGDGNGNPGSDSTRIAAATDYNSSRSNTTSSVDLGGDGNGDPGSDSTRIAAATDYNSSRSNTTSSIDLNDLGSDGFPDVMKTASISISKRSARTGRNQSLHKENTVEGQSALYEPKEELANNDGDGQGDVDGFHFDLEIDPIDPDDDGDGLMDALESATYSISKRSARTGRSAASGGKEIETMEWNEGAVKNQTSDIYKWTYNLSGALSNTGDLDSDGLSGLMKNATLTLLFTEGKVHVDLQVNPIDPDDDGDGFGDLLQNGSFSISKRSARTGR